MKGIKCNSNEVNAILAGDKSQIRLVAKINFKSGINQRFSGLKSFKFGDEFRISGSTDEVCEPFKCPHQIGDLVFVKEPFLQARGSSQMPSGEYETFWCSKTEYVADGAEERHLSPDSFYSDYMKRRPAQHMKQSQSRITLRIKDISVERLQDISEEDCWKEGCEEFMDYQDKIKVCEMAKQIGDCIEDPRPHFAVYWNSTHKKPEEKFEVNPWVFRYCYEVVNGLMK